MTAAETPKNPVVREASLRAAPGWIAREHADGTFVAADSTSPAISYPLPDFGCAVRWAQAEERGDDPQEAVASLHRERAYVDAIDR